MKKIILTLTALAAMITAGAQGNTYKILHECDTTIKCDIRGIPLGSRDIHFIVYEYPSKDSDGKDATISGVVIVPKNVADGTDPCDGTILYNHYTADSLAEAPSVGKGGLLTMSIILANPMKPNYVMVASDYIGFGSSADRKMSYMSNDVNARNSLDGLLAARQMLTDKQQPQGKYLFNLGYSQGANEAMRVAKLRDMEDKYKGIKFDKTFVSGGAFDFEEAYKGLVTTDYHPMWRDIVILVVWGNENNNWGLKYDEVFKEPLASKIENYLKTKNKYDLNMDTKVDSLHQVLQPAYMDLNSDQAKALMAKLKEMNLMNGWTIDPTQNYFISHSRHDDYVPVQSARALLTWMRDKGFKPSIVPGKTSLQTNMMLFKLGHTYSGVVWFIQTAAAMQFWPVVYYEGEQNRYLHNAVKDLNLMKAVKLLESLGIDLHSLAGSGSGSGAGSGSGSGSGGGITDFVSILMKIEGTLKGLGLTISDVLQMIDDSGISPTDLIEVIQYVTTPPAQARGVDESSNVEAPIYLLRHYEQTMANWFLLGGYDVDYGKWGW